MSDWSKASSWRPVEMTEAQMKAKIAQGARLICDEETFDIVQAMHVDLAGQGATDQEIAEAVCAFLDARKARMH